MEIEGGGEAWSSNLIQEVFQKAANSVTRWSHPFLLSPGSMRSIRRHPTA